MTIRIKDCIQNLNIVVGCNIGCPYCYARNNSQRFKIVEDFNEAVFFENKLRLFARKRPQIFLLTGMSDLAVWEKKWRDLVFAKIAENPQHQFLFLTKRPDLLNFECLLDNAWFGISITAKADLWRLKKLKDHIRAKHYHITFEPLFDDPGIIDFEGIDWIVIGTMTGPLKKKQKTRLEHALSLSSQAKRAAIPVFMKEELVTIVGEDKMVQESPDSFKKILEVQRKWLK